MSQLYPFDSSTGATYSEVLVALVLTLLGTVGAMGAFHAAGRGLSTGTLAMKALAMAESRIEAKRSVRWNQLLEDDLDHNGEPELLMHDDGAGGDRLAGDGVYSASWEKDGVRLTWTVTPNRAGDLLDSGFALIEARASFRSDFGEQEVRLATIRANPAFTLSH